MTLADKPVVAVTTRALVLGLVLLTTTAWAQTGPTGEQAAQRGFHVRWAPPTEGLDPDRHPVGRTLVWAFGDIVPGGETSFVAEPMPDAVSYRITVVSYDLVSQGQAP